jgi:hypothetical protein
MLVYLNGVKTGARRCAKLVLNSKPSHTKRLYHGWQFTILKTTNTNRFHNPSYNSHHLRFDSIEPYRYFLRRYGLWSFPRSAMTTTQGVSQAVSTLLAKTSTSLLSSLTPTAAATSVYSEITGFEPLILPKWVFFPFYFFFWAIEALFTSLGSIIKVPLMVGWDLLFGFTWLLVVGVVFLLLPAVCCFGFRGQADNRNRRSFQRSSEW